MVLEIRLNNFFSFKDEVILDLRAGNIKTAKSKSLSQNTFIYDDIEVVKSIAIYGANASGKSNLMNAIRFCNAMVYESHKHNENTRFNYKKFKFDGYTNKPSGYFIHFVLDDLEYEYSYSFYKDQVMTESLYYYPKGRIAKIFDRDERKSDSKKEKYSFTPSIIRRPMDVAENTSNKTLFISRASQMDREIPKKIFKFFYETFILRHNNYSKSNLPELINGFKSQLLTALQLADSDIIDFKLNVKKEKGKTLTANLDTEEVIFEESIVEKFDIKSYHRYSPNVAFDLFSEESSGTQKLFFMMLTILDVVKNGKTLLIDEIEDSLHPKIVEYIFKLFHASKEAQLIATTHNTNLLDLNAFRKDQIWFVNKGSDASSDLYSLYDYSDFRDNMNLEKAYLQGRFDSIPIVDNSTSKIDALIND